MTGLTDRQAAVLALIRGSIEQRGYPPTLREIGARMGIRSTNGVNDHLRALERKGFLVRDAECARAMRLAKAEGPEAQASAAARQFAANVIRQIESEIGPEGWNVRGRQVYFIESPGMRAIKIGITDDVPKRLLALQTGNPDILQLIGTAPGGPLHERLLHERFQGIRMSGEWFQASVGLRLVATHSSKCCTPFDTLKLIVDGDVESYIDDLAASVTVAGDEAAQ